MAKKATTKKAEPKAKPLTHTYSAPQWKAAIALLNAFDGDLKKAIECVRTLDKHKMA